jgi:hypothetical protein
MLALTDTGRRALAQLFWSDVALQARSSWTWTSA